LLSAPTAATALLLPAVDLTVLLLLLLLLLLGDSSGKLPSSMRLSLSAPTGTVLCSTAVSTTAEGGIL
jgi:hypothetical protein